MSNFLSRTTAAAMAMALAACGGLADEAPGAAAPAEVASTDKQPPMTALVDDEGRAELSHPALVPADAGARTRAGRYASAAQAMDLEGALGNGVLRVDVECCGSEAVDRAIGLAHGMQAAHDLPDSAPVLVRGADLRLGATAVDRLSKAGHANVWLVTQ
jgi:hypothetical protein